MRYVQVRLSPKYLAFKWRMWAFNVSSYIHWRQPFKKEKYIINACTDSFYLNRMNSNIGNN